MPRLHLPPRARLIYIPGDDSHSHEFVLRRRLLAIILGVAALLALLAVTFLSTYAVLVLRSSQVSRLQRELRDASDQLERVRELNKELDQMRRMQDQVLTMLGVPPVAPTGGAAPGAPAAASPGAVRLPDEPARRPAAAPAAAANPGIGLIAAPPPDLWPVSGYVTREFTPPDQDGKGGHAAVDIVAPLETPLKAAGKGIVTAAGWDNFLGNYVEITHGLGYVTVYGHCSRLSVKKGDRVDRAQQIGYLGGTGQASAPHLHFEVWKDGVPIDPRLVIPGDPPR
ncbi:MAG: M23 family metallopeptidase [Candidatus Krumholzibacteriia bacterium]